MNKEQRPPTVDHSANSHELVVTCAIGAALGLSVGFFLGISLATAKMLGDAEMFAPPDIPDAPSVELYMLVGSLVGGCAGGALGLLACRIQPILRRIK